jgi:hypothetical protein
MFWSRRAIDRTSPTMINRWTRPVESSPPQFGDVPLRTVTS